MARKKDKKFYKNSQDLRNVLEMSGLTQEVFSNKIGITRATLRNWIEKGGVNYASWQIIEKEFSHLLFTEPEVKQVYESNFRLVPIVTEPAYASYSSNWDDKEYMEDLQTRPTILPEDGNYLWFVVSGDSMESEKMPSIPEGSYVLARELYHKYWQKFNLTKFWVIHHRTQGLMVKKITKNENGIITCHSLNPIYEDFPLNLNEINQLFYIKEINHKL